LVFLMNVILWPNQATRATIGPTFNTAGDEINGQTVFSRLIEHNRWREARLQRYSVTRTYQIKSGSGKVRAESQVSMQYQSPGEKECKVLAESGSGIIRNRVFKPLMDSEVETALGRNRYDSSLSPANYEFELIGDEYVDGHHCFVVEATPRHGAKYLFR